MLYEYSQFNGKPFPTPEDLFPSQKVVNFILQYGEQALDAMEELDDGGEGEQMIEAMIEAGLLERDEGTGALKLTPKMVRGIEHRSLLEIFAGMQRGRKEGHETRHVGQGDERTDGTRPYEFGDPISELDLHATLANALHRKVEEQSQGGASFARSSTQGEAHATLPQPLPEREGGRKDAAPRAADASKNLLPIHITPADFELHNTEGRTDCALCVLIDMSGSMMRYGRFFQAKRVALGMAALMRRHFPQDTIDFVGFYSMAERIHEKDLPLVMPKPVSLYDPVVRLRVPLRQAQQNPKRVPQHFTNLQLGLRFARQILNARSAANKQIFIITDGQPTAHVATGSESGEEMLYLLYPPTDETSTITLKEALRCQQQGLRLSTFALVEDYWGMDWVGFVDQLTRLTRGTAFYCSSDDLSSTVIESYLNGKRRKSFVE